MLVLAVDTCTQPFSFILKSYLFSCVFLLDLTTLFFTNNILRTLVHLLTDDFLLSSAYFEVVTLMLHFLSHVLEINQMSLICNLSYLALVVSYCATGPERKVKTSTTHTGSFTSSFLLYHFFI